MKRQVMEQKEVSGWARLKAKLIMGGIMAVPMLAMAQGTSTDATDIANNAWTAFVAIAPITVSIAGFYVILRLAKRSVK